MENNFAMPNVCLWSKGVSCVIGFHGLSAFSFVIGRVQSRLLNCLLHLLSFNRSWKEIVQRLFSGVSFWKIRGLLYFDRWLVKEVLKRWGKGGGACNWRERREVSCFFWDYLTNSEWLFFFLTRPWKKNLPTRPAVGRQLYPFYDHFWVFAFYCGTLYGNRLGYRRRNCRLISRNEWEW